MPSLRSNAPALQFFFHIPRAPLKRVATLDAIPQKKFDSRHRTSLQNLSPHMHSADIHRSRASEIEYCKQTQSAQMSKVGLSCKNISKRGYREFQNSQTEFKIEVFGSKVDPQSQAGE
jgi:hypothetical protein